MTEKVAPIKAPRTPSFRLDGKRALVTGAGRGLGLAAAAALAQAGAHVTLVARTSPDVEALAQAIVDDGGSAEALPLDVLDLASLRAALDAREAFDILVNSAGTNRPAAFTSVTEADFDAVMGLNLRSLFFVSQIVSKRMIASKRAGSIIHVSSQMGHVGGALRTVYCASKHAVEGLTKSMAIDLAPHGIRVNSISPTFIETPMTKPFFESADFKSQVLGKIKLGRIGTVEDVMGAIVLLASEAASLMTGSSLMIDGGWTAE